MSKIYVLDTNVLLQDPMSIFSFQDNEVVIPAVVLEELDAKKRNMDEVGKNARYVSRLIDQLRTKGKLHSKVPMSNGGMLRIEMNHRSPNKVQEYFAEKTNDNRILTIAKNLSLEEQAKEHGRSVILVSKDILMRVKADVIGLLAEDFLSDRVIDENQLYSGFIEIFVSQEELNEFYAKGELATPSDLINSVYLNQFVIIKCTEVRSLSALGIISESLKKIKKLRYNQEHIWGIKPRNVQQYMAMELLLRSDCQLVTLTGKA